MRFYVQHRRGQPHALGPERQSAQDIEISEALAALFYDAEELLEHWEIVDGRMVKNVLGVRLGDGSMVELGFVDKNHIGTGLVISPLYEEGVVEFFLSQDIIHNIHTKQFTFLIDKTAHVIDLTQFEEGQFSLHTPLRKRNTFSVQRIVENLYLVPDYAKEMYRQRNRTISATYLSAEPDERITFSLIEDPNVIVATQSTRAPFVPVSNTHAYLRGLRIRAS